MKKDVKEGQGIQNVGWGMEDMQDVRRVGETEGLVSRARLPTHVIAMEIARIEPFHPWSCWWYGLDF